MITLLSPTHRSHPASVEYARFFTRYNYDAKRWSPERKQVQRAGPPDHMNDSFSSLRACNLSNKWDPLRMSANIAEQVDTRHPGTNHHIKFGYKCENDLIGLSGAKHMVREVHACLHHDVIRMQPRTGDKPTINGRYSMHLFCSDLLVCRARSSICSPGRISARERPRPLQT